MERLLWKMERYLSAVFSAIEKKNTLDSVNLWKRCLACKISRYQAIMFQFCSVIHVCIQGVDALNQAYNMGWGHFAREPGPIHEPALDFQDQPHSEGFVSFVNKSVSELPHETKLYSTLSAVWGSVMSSVCLDRCSFLKMNTD